jgi:hypothetical protein
MVTAESAASDGEANMAAVTMTSAISHPLRRVGGDVYRLRLEHWRNSPEKSRTAVRK